MSLSENREKEILRHMVVAGNVSASMADELFDEIRRLRTELRRLNLSVTTGGLTKPIGPPTVADGTQGMRRGE